MFAPFRGGQSRVFVGVGWATELEVSRVCSAVCWIWFMSPPLDDMSLGVALTVPNGGGCAPDIPGGGTSDMFGVVFGC